MTESRSSPFREFIVWVDWKFSKIRLCNLERLNSILRNILLEKELNTKNKDK